MYLVSKKTKELYRRDLPEVNKIPNKELVLSFENNFEIKNQRIHEGSFSFSESICDESNIKFGGCIASCLKVKIAGLDRDISGERFYAVHKIEGGDDIPYGYFTVDSAKLTNDSEHREIIAYDDIYSKLNKDVIEWYKSLALPMPLKVFRQSLFSYIGIPIEEQELANDNVIIERTVDADYLNGVDVAKAIGEINGTFGLMGRGGKFKYIMLAGTGLYPAEDLYPSEDLFPAEATEQFGKVGYRETKYEEYSTAPIDCLKIRQQDGDVGAHSPQTGKWENPYIITGNFLVYGKNAAQLQEICDNIFNVIRGISYRPHATKLNGLPYIEPGDSFTLEKKRDSIDSYVFSRTITGSQALIDTWQASGDMYLQNEVSANTEIQMLKGRATIIEKSVEGIKVTVTDLEADTNSKFEQTANRITAEVANINQDMSSRFQITNNAITAEVQRATGAEGQLSSRINVTESNITAEVKRAKDAEETLSGKISVEADRITAEVQRATGAEGTLSTRVELTEKGLTSKVSKGNLSSEISQEAGKISIKSDRFSLQSTNCTITEDGTIRANNVELSGEIIASSGRIGSLTGGFTITQNSIYNEKSSLYGSEKGIYIGTDGISCGEDFKFWIPSGNAGWKQVNRPKFCVTTDGDIFVGSGSVSLGEDSDMTLIKGGSISISKTPNISATGSKTLIEMGSVSVSAAYGWLSLSQYGLSLSTSSTGTAKRILSITTQNYGMTLGAGDTYLGFFGHAPSQKNTVSKISNTSSATASTNASKINDIITALNNYGLI